MARNARAAEEGRGLKEQGLLDASEVAEILGVGRNIVSIYRRRGLEPSVELVGGLRRPRYEPKEVERFLRIWLRSKDGRSRLMFDPDHVVNVWRGHGWLARFADRRDLSEDEAEAILRRRVEKRRELLRHACGRKATPGPPLHHLDWAEAFGRLQAELEDYAERTGDRPPASLDIALAVAEADFTANRGRWKDYPGAGSDPSALDPRFAREASRRVWKAVKPLLSPVTGMRPT